MPSTRSYLGMTVARSPQAVGSPLSNYRNGIRTIGSTCSGLQPDYYICVSAVGVDAEPTTTTKDNEVTTPTPTQSGMVGTCSTFYRVGGDDTCEIIAKAAGITLANFYDWNKGVGSDCGSLWLLYCVYWSDVIMLLAL